MSAYEPAAIPGAEERTVFVASNRGPVSLVSKEDGTTEVQRNSGGLVTALIGLAQQNNFVWLSSTSDDREAAMGGEQVSFGESARIRLEYIQPEEQAYQGYYNVIANPLLWFLQHSMWNLSLSPVIDASTWNAWEHGYKAVNRLFAEKLGSLLRDIPHQPVVMFQDYHLYLAPRMLRNIRQRRRRTMLHFIHIPWPGPEYWGILPPGMRHEILDGLCAVDLLGFQTHEDGLNFIRTCESYLPTAGTTYKHGVVWYRNHKTYVRDFPISIDVDSLRQQAASPPVARLNREITASIGKRKLILRIDRIEPSKNIVRGFQAFEEMLEHHPEHAGRVTFLALLVPSRQDVPEYKEYLDAVMSSVGRVNATYGSYTWEPIRLLMGEDYDQAIAAMQLYDILLVNAIADGMNLVAKEGPIVNRRNGVLILSDRTGARQQLVSGATIIPPCDIHATAEAMHQGLLMDAETRKQRATRLRWLIENNDINVWMQSQFEMIKELGI